MLEQGKEGSTKKGEPGLRWSPLGRLPLATKLDGYLIRAGIIRGDQFIDQRLTSVLESLSDQREIISEAVKSIIISHAKDEREGRANIYVTRLNIERKGEQVFLVPDRGSRIRRNTPRYTADEIYRTLTSDNGLFIVLDQR